MIPLSFRLLPTLSLISLCAVSAHAAVVTWDAGGGTGAGQQWTTPLNWNDDTAPASGNTYEVNSGTIRTVDDATSAFVGDSLTVSNGASLYYFRTNGGTGINVAVSIPTLVVDNANILVGGTTGTVTFNQTSSLALANTVGMNFNAGGSNSIILNLNGGLTGSGTLNVTRTTTGTNRTLAIASTVAYTGNINVTGAGASDLMALSLNNGAASGWGSGDLALNNFAQLNLGVALSALTSTVSMTSGALFNLGSGNSAIEGLVFNSIAAAPDTYTSGELNTLFGTTAFSGTGNLTIVPEPTAAMLGGIGLLTLLRRRRK